MAHITELNCPKCALNLIYGATTVVVEDSDFLWPIPNHWSMSDASTPSLAYCTAYHALVIRGRIREGETVLIHSGSGAVGQTAIRIALNYG